MFRLVWQHSAVTEIAKSALRSFRLVRQHSTVTEIVESALRSPCHGYVRHSTLLFVINLHNLLPIIIILLIREAKILDPFLRRLRFDRHAMVMYDIAHCYL